jgi:type II secretory pathway predicted ATPase ExeA/outer membrane protein OmpA-like peptidoglycan-associated protein
MYESFFGFEDTPFRLSADEKYRYAHHNYLRASAYLAYALQQGEGLVMITGDPGSGKTTLIRDVISELEPSIFHTINLVTSQLHAEELLRKVALEFGLPAETYNKATLLTNIHKKLAAMHEQGKRSILFLDEAQNLSPNGLEELRLLSNLQQGKHSLLQIVLVGHQDLRRLLLGPDMEHFQQRLIAVCQLEPMNDEQTREYIVHRLELVGWHQDPEIRDEVFQLIHLVSKGVPRNINHLMSQLLLFAALEEKHELSDDDALVIIEELVDQQRIILPEALCFDEFVNKYRAENQTLLMRQAVGARSGISTSSHARPLRNHEKQGDSVTVTKSGSGEPQSANDQPGEERAVKLEAPDTDWFLWNNDTEAEIDPGVTASEDGENTATSYRDRHSPEGQSENAADRDRRSGIGLPNADEIWQGTSSTVDMASIYADNRFQKTALNSETKSQNTTIQPVGGQVFRDREHRWGGVWFMSSDNSTTLPSASVLNSSHKITVDENLRMPSVWIEGCPEVTTRREDSPRSYHHKPDHSKGLKRSIKHVTVWVSIGVAAMLTVRMFPTQLEGFWDEMTTRLYGEQASIQTVTPLIPEIGQVERTPRTVPADMAGVEIVEDPEIAAYADPPEKADKAENVAISEETPLEVGDSDISSFEHIELATRYIIYFDFNRSSIPTQYQPLLKSIRNKMLLEERSFLKITGYADSQGDRNYNFRLSMKRAEAVKSFFTLRGIADERLQVAAIGSVGTKEPWLESIANRREIRRVEVILFPK